MFKRRNKSICIGFSVSLVITIIILITNIHNGIKFTGDYTLTPKHNLLRESKYAGTINKLALGITNLLPESVCLVKDRYQDLTEAIEYIALKEQPEEKPAKIATLADFFNIEIDENTTVLDKFNLDIRQNELYANDSKLVDELLHEMATRKIVRVDEKSGGTQIKLRVQFDNGMLALVKPMRFPREQQALPDRMQYAEFERHTAEIAAFHLDKILGFRRTMPVVGRLLNMTSEIYDLAKQNLTQTFFTSPQPDRNLCFYGTCSQYCDIDHPICGEKDMLETAFIGFLPTYFDDIDIDETQNPWRKSYNEQRRAIWERDPKYCDKIKAQSEYKNGKWLLSLMDLSIFDFLTGNRDRHSFEYFTFFDEDSCFIHFDNGRGFGHAFFDDGLNLMPLVQCCVIRASTLKTLLSFQNGPKPLSQLMKESMAMDPIGKIRPILWQPHLEALDRRVNIILRTLRECIETHSIHDVIYPRDNFGEN